MLNKSDGASARLRSGHLTALSPKFRAFRWLIVSVCLCPFAALAEEFEREPIRYSAATPDNVVSRLQARLDSGASRLEFADEQGYLRSVLQELKVPLTSQTLVFSKTSLQRQRIAPRSPRAVYFSDNMYVGFCQNGEVLELSAVDPQLGAVFYTLSQERADKPKFVRQTENCLICHASSHTHGIPGTFVRSLYVDRGGMPVLGMGTHRVDHSSPIARRWGGWYVTGTHGQQTHLGNLILTDKVQEPVDNSVGFNVTDLSERFKTAEYLTPHSDLVALMVLDHQAEGHNLITQASFKTREALYAETQLNKELKEPEGHRWASTTTRIKSGGEALVKYLLFCEEAPLTEKLVGSTSYAEEFTKLGPRDSQGRSLRDFDLTRRMFKYPCSYLIYTEAFDALPCEVKEFVLRRLWEVLTGKDQSKEFAHLSPADRQAVLEILRATKPGLPTYWDVQKKTTDHTD